MYKIYKEDNNWILGSENDPCLGVYDSEEDAKNALAELESKAEVINNDKQD